MPEDQARLTIPRAVLGACFWAACWLTLSASFLSLGTLCVWSRQPGLSLAAPFLLGAAGASALALRRGTIKNLALMAGILAALTLTALGTVCGVRAHWRHRVAQAKSELHARGLAVSLAEFRDDIPEARFGEAALSKVIDGEFKPDDYAKAPAHPGEKPGIWSERTYKLESPHAARYAGFFAQLAPLAARGYSGYKKIDFAQAARNPLATPLPPLRNFSAVARIARVSAAARAFEGRADLAWPLVRLIFDLSDPLAADRPVLEKMVALGLRRQGVEAVLAVLLNSPKTGLPKDIAGRLSGMSGQHLVLDAARTELASELDAYERQAAASYAELPALLGGGGGLVEAAGCAAVRDFGVLDINMLAMTRFFALVLSVRSPVLATDFAPVCAQEAQAWLLSQPWWPYLIAQQGMADWDGLLRKEADVQALAQLALLLPGLERERARRGAYPAALPSSGLLYKAAAGGFELCAPGARGDRLDSTGKELCVRRP